MISTNDLKNGITIEYEGAIYVVMETQHVKPGKGAAIVKAKLKNLRTGAIFEQTFNAGVKVATARIEKQQMQYLYNMNDTFYFMNMETYEQLEIPADKIGDQALLLKENLVNLGELTQPGDSLPRLQEDSCTLLSPNNVIDMNLICANYEGTKEENKILNNELIVSGEIIDMKDSVISQKDTIHQKTVQAYEGKLKKEKTKKRTWVGVSGGLALILGLIIAL